MIEFGGYYHVAAEEIAAIQTDKGSKPEYPYDLTIMLKNGERMGVSYTEEKARDVDRRKILAQISREQRQDYERMYNKLYLVEDAVRRIDKRQLRIWRILSKLLPVKEEDVEHD